MCIKQIVLVRFLNEFLRFTLYVTLGFLVDVRVGDALVGDAFLETLTVRSFTNELRIVSPFKVA